MDAVWEQYSMKVGFLVIRNEASNLGRAKQDSSVSFKTFVSNILASKWLHVSCVLPTNMIIFFRGALLIAVQFVVINVFWICAHHILQKKDKTDEILLEHTKWIDVPRNIFRNVHVPGIIYKDKLQ